MGKKIVFFCIPAHGHTNPTLGVVRELTGRGHQVWYYSYLAFREQIEEAGAKFIACDEYDAQQKITPRKAARVGKDLHPDSDGYHPFAGRKSLSGYGAPCTGLHRGGFHGRVGKGRGV